MKKITLLLHHEGLANRMRVIGSLYPYYYLTAEITVIWMLSNELNCPFEQLFEPIPRISIINSTQRPNLYNSRQRNPLKRIIARLYNHLKGYDYVIIGGSNNKDSMNMDLIKTAIDNNQKLLIETCNAIHTPDFNIFKPIKEINDQISNSHLPSKSFIGIHIRRGDHKDSQQKSGIVSFIEKAKEILNNNPKQKFFLATDSQDVKDVFLYIFGNDTIITHKSDYSRNNNTGIQDALFELIILSKAETILGSYWSSFDEVAAELGHTKLIKIINK